ERIARHLNKDVCDPTDPDNSCSEIIKKSAKITEMKKAKKNSKEIAEEIRQESCPICNIFGNGYLSSKIFFTDVHGETTTEQIIENVGIDRFTGGAADGAKFNTEVATSVNLRGKIILKNIDEWQAGLIAFVIRDWIMGDIRIGFGKMKGYGRCKVNLDKITLCWQDSNKWLTDKIEKSGENGLYNHAVLEDLKLAEYKNVLEGLYAKLKDEVKNEAVC
ncbi:MAG: RAMP superfamily CRISPR-associated protein, partial [Candidatus Desantisbacteria bacterium]